MGILFDSSLTFRNHINTLRESINKSVKPLQRIHTAKTSILLKVLLFKAYIQSKITYSSIILNFAQNKTDMLQTLLTQSLKKCFNLPKNTNCSKLLKALGIMNV